MTPPVASATTCCGISPSSLNRLEAKVLCAKLMNAPELEEYEAELRRAKDEEGGVRMRVEVLPAKVRGVVVFRTACSRC